MSSEFAELSRLTAEHGPDVANQVVDKIEEHLDSRGGLACGVSWSVTVDPDGDVHVDVRS